MGRHFWGLGKCERALSAGVTVRCWHRSQTCQLLAIRSDLNILTEPIRQVKLPTPYRRTHFHMASIFLAATTPSERDGQGQIVGDWPSTRFPIRLASRRSWSLASLRSPSWSAWASLGTVTSGRGASLPVALARRRLLSTPGCGLFASPAR
jgi:hypothetical protein